MNQKVEPLPGALARPISPPIIVTRRRQIARPSPVPPKRRVVELSDCVNDSNTLACASGAMPTPVSSTSQRSLIASPSPAINPSRSATLPRSVNFTALPSRLTRTWRSRTGSPRRPAGTAASTLDVNARPFSCARRATTAVASRTSTRGSKSIASSVSLPASIFEKSRMSLMMSSRATPEPWIVCSCSR